MINKTIKQILSFWIFCMMLIQPNPTMPPQNSNQIKSSDEDYTNVTMENINNTDLKFRIDSSRDVTAFRLWYITNHTNGSSFYTEGGGMGDIFGVQLIPSALQFWSIPIKNLFLYQEGGYLYTFLMKIYFINPIDEDIFFADRIELDPYPQEDDDPIEDDDPPEDDNEGDGIPIWVWIIIVVIIIGFGICGFIRSKRKSSESPMNEKTHNGEKITNKTQKGLDNWKKKFHQKANN